MDEDEDDDGDDAASGWVIEGRRGRGCFGRALPLLLLVLVLMAVVILFLSQLQQGSCLLVSWKGMGGGQGHKVFFSDGF